jgi:hypothetical protein
VKKEAWLETAKTIKPGARVAAKFTGVLGNEYTIVGRYRPDDKAPMTVVIERDQDKYRTRHVYSRLVSISEIK